MALRLYFINRSMDNGNIESKYKTISMDIESKYNSYVDNDRMNAVLFQDW